MERKPITEAKDILKRFISDKKRDNGVKRNTTIVANAASAGYSITGGEVSKFAKGKTQNPSIEKQIIVAIGLKSTPRDLFNYYLEDYEKFEEKLNLNPIKILDGKINKLPEPDKSAMLLSVEILINEADRRLAELDKKQSEIDQEPEEKGIEIPAPEDPKNTARSRSGKPQKIEKPALNGKHGKED